jgi:hypothetical protein
MQAGKNKKPRLGAGLSLDKFSKAKKSTYDPRIVKEKERALNAKKASRRSMPCSKSAIVHANKTPTTQQFPYPVFRSINIKN